MEDDFDFDALLSGGSAETAQTETNEEPVVETGQETPADIETETEAEPEIDPSEDVAETSQRDPKMVPLAALQKERATKRDLAAELDALRTKVAQFEAPKQEAIAPQIEAIDDIDPYDNPTEWKALQQRQIAQAAAYQVRETLFQQNLPVSLAKAHSTYGKEYCDEVADWAGQMAESDPTFETKLKSQPDPAQWAIDEKNRHDMFTAFRSDPDAWALARAQQLGHAVSEETAPATPAKKPAGPSSMVAARSAQTDLTSKKAQVDQLNAIFDKK